MFAIIEQASQAEESKE